MESAGGGWTVFQRRFDGQVSFNRTWREYRDGFGSAQKEHWLGNAVLHALTANGQHTLHVTLQDWHQQTRHANYNKFKVAAENQRYKGFVSHTCRLIVMQINATLFKHTGTWVQNAKRKTYVLTVIYKNGQKTIL